MDFLLVETVRTGLLTDLTPPEMAAAVSGFVYEPRRESDSPDALPTGRLQRRWSDLVDLWDSHTSAERAHRLPTTRPPEPGFASLAYAWARDLDLEVLLEDEALSPGDFVRNARQLLDVLRQIRDASEVLGVEQIGRVIAPLHARMDRGVVAAGGVG